MKLLSFELFAVDLPFRKPFKHAAAERSTSDSLFLRCTLENGVVGWGESLPRHYVTGETRDQSFALLRDTVLPRLLHLDFGSLDEVVNFLQRCDGQAPSEWVSADTPQTAAWCAVDLALLDAFSRASKTPLETNLQGEKNNNSELRYSAVLSADHGLKYWKSLLKVKAFGFSHVKLKVEKDGSLKPARLARRVLGKGCDIRADANMAWNVEEAIMAMKNLAACGISSFEQPMVADDIDGAARLIRETGLGVMADESLHTRASLQNLIEKKAITAANVRISKCGGLVAALNRCRDAQAANIQIQVGCQVGESSLLSAGHVLLLSAAPRIQYAEGCFGLLLLREDPVEPLVQFGKGGSQPLRSRNAEGLGVQVNEEVLQRYAGEKAVVE